MAEADRNDSSKPDPELVEYMASVEQSINRQLTLADSIEQRNPEGATRLRIKAQQAAREALDVWDWMQFHR